MPFPASKFFQVFFMCVPMSTFAERNRWRYPQVSVCLSIATFASTRRQSYHLNPHFFATLIYSTNQISTTCFSRIDRQTLTTQLKLRSRAINKTAPRNSNRTSTEKNNPKDEQNEKKLNANISNHSNIHNPTNRGTNKRSVHNTKQHKNMSNRVTKAVTMLSSIHDVKSSVRNVFYSQKHFPKVLGSSMLCAFVGTYCMMESIHQGRLRVRSIFLSYSVNLWTVETKCSSYSYVQEQEKQYSEAWEVYSEEKQVSLKIYELLQLFCSSWLRCHI